MFYEKSILFDKKRQNNTKCYKRVSYLHIRNSFITYVTNYYLKNKRYN